MVAGGVVVLLLSAIGVNLYGWSNLADELLCGLVVLISYLIGACAHPKREGGASLGGAFGADFSWLGILFWAPAALAAGLVRRGFEYAAFLWCSFSFTSALTCEVHKDETYCSTECQAAA